MRFSPVLPALLALATAAATPVWSADAEGAATGTRTLRSPFMPPAAPAQAEAAAPVEDATLQFCGLFGDGDQKRFCVYNVSKNRSHWLMLGEEGPDEIVVQSYDPDQNAVVVRQGSRTVNLALQSAKIAPGARTAVASTGPVSATPSQAIRDTVKVNPTPADERARLEAVAAEVRRRRALRQQAANQGQ